MERGVLIRGVLLMVRDSDLAVLVRLWVPYSMLEMFPGSQIRGIQ